MLRKRRTGTGAQVKSTADHWGTDQMDDRVIATELAVVNLMISSTCQQFLVSGGGGATGRRAPCADCSAMAAWIVPLRAC